MNQNVWYEQSGMPNQAYLDFVARYLLQLEAGQPLVDPFSLNLTVDHHKDAYVVRTDVEKEIVQSGTQIIVGMEGSGKTTLWQMLSSLPRRQTLSVPFPVAQIGVSFPEKGWAQGQASLLAPELLVRHIFNAYWADLLRQPAKRARFLPRLRDDGWWMSKLRWFYQHYRPVDADIPAETELMAWLNAPSASLVVNRTTEDVLQDLVRLVVRARRDQQEIDAPFLQPYTGIQVLIDETEHLSDQAINRLIQDIQKLQERYTEHIQFKLFVDQSRQRSVEPANVAPKSQIKIYRLPQWRQEELRQILYLRIITWKPGEYAGPNWGELVPRTHLESIARERLVDTIIRSAIRAYSLGGSNLDTPIHTLRLAQGLLAACAGCWSEQGYEPPLDHRQIQKLADLYWEAEKRIPVVDADREETAMVSHRIPAPARAPQFSAIVRADDCQIHDGDQLDRPFRVSERLRLQAGIRGKTTESCENKAALSIWPEGDSQSKIVVKIVIHAKDMDIRPTRVKSYTFRQREALPLIEFELTPMEPGLKRVRIEFFAWQYWLAKIEFAVEITEAREPILQNR